jgi:DNA-binding XRE family transcriptional regulator
MKIFCNIHNIEMKIIKKTILEEIKKRWQPKEYTFAECWRCKKEVTHEAIHTLPTDNRWKDTYPLSPVVKKLQTKRKIRGMTINQLAKKIHVAAPTIIRAEKSNIDRCIPIKSLRSLLSLYIHYGDNINIKLEGITTRKFDFKLYHLFVKLSRIFGIKEAATYVYKKVYIRKNKRFLTNFHIYV